MKYLAASIVSFAIGILCALAISSFADTVTDDFAARYNAGTVEPSAIASDRTITFSRITEKEGRTTAFYRTNVTVAGEQKDSYGVMELTSDSLMPEKDPTTYNLLTYGWVIWLSILESW